MTPTVLATRAAAVVAVIAMVLLVAASLTAHGGVTALGIGALVGVPVARNLAIVVAGEPTDRRFAIVGIGLVVVVAAIVVLQR